MLLSGLAFPRGAQDGDARPIRPGDLCDLVLVDLFDDDGDRLLVPIQVVLVEDDSLKVDFRDQVSELAGTVRRLLSQSEDEVRAISGEVTYSIGPGFFARAQLSHAQWEDSSGAVDYGTVGILGFSYNF